MSDPRPQEFMIHCQRVVYERNEQYGDAWREVGLQGAVIEIHAKWSRLKQLVLRQGLYKIEDDRIKAILDVLTDMNNYSAIAAACLLSGYWLVDEAPAKVKENETAARIAMVENEDFADYWG